jgi:hypothetical protein
MMRALVAVAAPSLLAACPDSGMGPDTTTTTEASTTTTEASTTGGEAEAFTVRGRSTRRPRSASGREAASGDICPKKQILSAIEMSEETAGAAFGMSEETA